MSRNSSGTYSLPAGNPVVSGTSISSTVQNATLADIATEITNSLDRSGRGAMTGQLQLANGSGVAPSLSFSAEPASGLYRANTNDFRMQVNSSQIQQWTAAGIAISGTASTTGSATIGGTLAVQNGATFATTTTNGNGLAATGNGIGQGLVGTGGPGGAGGYFNAGTAATSSVAQYAIIANQGFIGFQTPVNPNSNVGFTNAITPKNICKAWARVATNGGGGVSLIDGFNVSTPSMSGSSISIPFQSPMAAASNPAPFAMCSVGLWCSGTANSTAASISAYDQTGQINLSTNGVGYTFYFFLFGIQ